jgi:hypothetical protein
MINVPANVPANERQQWFFGAAFSGQASQGNGYFRSLEGYVEKRQTGHCRLEGAGND